MANDTANPDEIERALTEERDALSAKLTELHARYAPEQLLREASRGLVDHGGELGSAMVETVRRNPVAAGLAGAGLAWLAYGAFTDNPKRGAADADAKAPSAARRMTDRATGRGEAGRADPAWLRDGGAGETDLAGRAGESYRRVRDRAGEGAERMRRKIGAAGDTFSDSVDQIRGDVGHARDAVSALLRDLDQTARATRRDIADVAQTGSEEAGHIWDSLTDGTGELSAAARERVVAARRRALEACDTAYDRAGAGLARTRDAATGFVQEKPLMAGAIALAAGALLLRALPGSERRKESDETPESLIDQAERIFEEERQKARTTTDRAERILKDAGARGRSAVEAVTRADIEAMHRIEAALKARADRLNTES